MPGTRVNPLKLLRRTDKWYLGGGNRLIWTPPFPSWLDRPGFWDKAHYYNFELEPVFTWTLLDEGGNEIPLKAVSRSWDPSALVVRYSAGGSGVGVTETRSCLPNDVLCSLVTLVNRSKRPQRLHLVAWTVQPGSAELRRGAALFTRHLTTGGEKPFPVFCAFGFGRAPSSFSLSAQENAAGGPHWRFTPFAEKFRKGRLPDDRNQGAAAAVALHLRIGLAPSERAVVPVFFAAAPTAAEARSNLAFAARQDDPAALSEQNWLDYFAGMPSFVSSDELLTRYYWYRWYGLRLMTIDPEEGNYRRPVVCEGIGYFRAPISYSAPCHMLENRWRHDPSLARGSLLTFIDNQRPDGGFRGYIDVDRYRQEMFYHARWGKALRALHAVHPDRQFLASVYPGLCAYAGYVDRERDPERSGLFDITNHYETGQEYMHRYVAVAPGADREHWGEQFRLKGVDVAVYMYEIRQALAWMAGELGFGAEAETHRALAERTGEAVRERMWDPGQEMFFDLDPATGARTGVKALTCFYPYLTDIVSGRHLHGLKRHLFDPKEFWTPFPFPSSSADDPFFSADAEWKGERKNCPWNGRVWPMTNSHMADLLGECAERFDDAELRRRCADFITKFVGMMFWGPARPNAFEHYSPLTGRASEYRGVDDYQHSWVNDLILTYVVGLRVEGETIVVRPADGIFFEVRDLLVAGSRLEIIRDRRGLRVRVNGRNLPPAAAGGRIVVS